MTKWIGAYPAPRKTAEESMRALQHFVGKEKVSLLYTDGSGELEKASLGLGIPNDVSTPRRPQNNGVAERMVRRIIEGTRCCLFCIRPGTCLVEGSHACLLLPPEHP